MPSESLQPIGGVPMHPVTTLDDFVPLRRPRTGLPLVIWQMAATYVLLMILGVLILSSLVVSYDGGLSILLWAFTLSVSPTLTLVVTELPGLPLRWVPRACHWWAKHWWIGVVGTLTGLALIGSSYLFNHLDTGVVDGEYYAEYVPDGWLMLAGWLGVAFFASHTVFPSRRKHASSAT
ncbi:hypothetical protein QFZ52_001671 [Arthrobacter woluwensis]|nr:hypothetical protein [Arthrobacter woluwensis]